MLIERFKSYVEQVLANISRIVSWTFYRKQSQIQYVRSQYLQFDPKRDQTAGIKYEGLIILIVIGSGYSLPQ